ncbi:MAG: LysM peptidoglycan-binding domain-containing protein [Eubacteriales bacterium]|nr:LysM peptidoglycan-binding domain-containing protein [Eubacteriales bacterium]
MKDRISSVKNFKKYYNNYAGNNNLKISGHLKKRNFTRNNNSLRAIFVIFMLIMFTVAVSHLMTVSASDEGHKSEPQLRYYTSISIEADETLWNIAEEYNNGEESNTHYINSIKSLNNMNSDTLYSGQNLIVYYFSSEIKN